MLGLTPSLIISHIFVLLIAFPIHEFAHAWTADRFGDSTPRLNGRLTLNPLAHLDPMGSLLILVANFGWAKPVPVNPYVLARHSPAALMWVSLAGPFSNLLMAVVAAIPFQLGLVTAAQAQMDMLTGSTRFLPTIPQLLWVFISINLILMLFNLIPLFPLDGEKIAAYFFPPSWVRFLDVIRPYSPLILLALAFLGAFGVILTPTLNVLMRFLVG